MVSATPIGNLPDYPRTISLITKTNPDNDIIYAAVGTSKVYKSTDGGNTFVSKSNGLPDVSAVMLTNNYGYTNISISPADNNYIYVKPHYNGDIFIATMEAKLG